MYTKRLRIAIIADILYIISMPLTSGIYDKLPVIKKMPFIAVASVITAAWIIAKLAITGKYIKFDNIWGRFPPRWVDALWFVFLTYLIAKVVLGRVTEINIISSLFMTFFGYQDYIKDKLACRRAYMFDMDQISSIEEIVEKYPGSEWLLKSRIRKQLSISSE